MPQTTSRGRRIKFAERLLKWTDIPANAIATRTGLRPEAVSELNIIKDIRTPERVRRIQIEAGRRKNTKRKRTNLFSPEQKIAILKDCDGMIWAGTLRMWQDTLIKNNFASPQALRNDIHTFLFQELDYFDPGKKTKSRNPVTHQIFIANYINYFSRMTRRKILRSSREAQFGVDSEGKTIEGRQTPYSAIRWNDKRTMRREIMRMPASAKYFIRNLGLTVESVAQIGFETFKDRIDTIANNNETNLTEREKNLVISRLGGKKLREIGETAKKPITRERIRQIEQAAIKKIRAALMLNERTTAAGKA